MIFSTCLTKPSFLKKQNQNKPKPTKQINPEFFLKFRTSLVFFLSNFELKSSIFPRMTCKYFVYGLLFFLRWHVISMQQLSPAFLYPFIVSCNFHSYSLTQMSISKLWPVYPSFFKIWMFSLPPLFVMYLCVYVTHWWWYRCQF